MVAYSFKARFSAPILAGTKTQTIRADRKRHAQPGEELQLYTGMRTKQCKLIKRATCTSIEGVRLDFEANTIAWWVIDDDDGNRHDAGVFNRRADLDRFARQDGFADWADLCAFWKAEHASIDQFEGVIIGWAP